MKLRSLILLLVVTAGVSFTSAAHPQKQLRTQEAVYVYIGASQQNQHKPLQIFVNEKNEEAIV